MKLEGNSSKLSVPESFPMEKATADMPVEEIILSSRPSQLEADDISEIAWYAIWLTQWTYFAITETVVRARSLGFPQNKKIARERESVFRRNLIRAGPLAPRMDNRSRVAGIYS